MIAVHEVRWPSGATNTPGLVNLCFRGKADMADYEVLIARRKGVEYEVKVDAEDYAWAKEIRWYISTNGYVVVATSRSGREYLHRLIMRPGPDQHVDHVSRDKLDNRRINLRLCDRRGNMRNRAGNKDSTSRYKGVCWHIAAQKWHAQIGLEGRHLNLGLYETEIQAALIYDQVARFLFGEFAYTNFPGTSVLDPRLITDNRKTSVYRGVYWSNSEQKWRAFIAIGKTLKTLGRFLTEIDAALAYDKAARIVGQKLNFPEGFSDGSR